MIVYIPVLMFALVGALVVPVLARLFRRCRMETITPEWLENFSPSSYYPMERLLNDEDFQFLSRQPGFDLSLYRKLRRDRLRIFRQYFNRLISDFNRLHTIARLSLAQSQGDHSELMYRLVALKLRFSISVLRIEFTYVWCRLGLQSLSVTAAIAKLEEMSAFLNSIAGPQAIPQGL